MDPMLVRIELTFRTTTDEDAGAFGERIKESVRMIVGREALEDFRVRAIPLGEPPSPGPLD